MGLFLSDLTWEDAKKAFDRIQTVMIPIGSTEQHGPHLPLGTDWMIAEELAKRVTPRLDIITTQVIPVGYTEHHMDFPGTISVKMNNLTNYMIDICESLIQWGAKRFVLMNGHGGNLDSLTQVAGAIREKYGILSTIIQWWEAIPEFRGELTDPHAGYAETAIAAVIRHDCVKYDRAKIARTRPLTESIVTGGDTLLQFKGGIFRTFLRTRDISSLGSMVEQFTKSPERDLSSVPVEYGHAYLGALTELIVEFVQDFSKVGPFEPTEHRVA
jgi:creatinine amidohydrolase